MSSTVRTPSSKLAEPAGDKVVDRGLPVPATGKSVLFVVPTTWQGETVLRFCFVNPRTTVDEVAAILEDLRRT